MANKINDIPLKESENNQERAILGFISEIAEHIKYGKIKIEITIHNGKMTNIQQDIDGATIRRSLNLHNI